MSYRPSPRNADTITGALTLALGLTALMLAPGEVQSDGFRQFGNVRSPAFFPILAGGATAAISLILLVRGALQAAPPISVERPGRVLTVTAALTGATAMIFWVGYIAAAAALIAALSLTFGNRRPVVVARLALAAPVAIYLLFNGVLDVLLPAGPF
ncbi:Tripartite tricarboxylate transporter TctB family protein [Jannaschia seohaensis]|uniref:Tripartite tricarboxylate transporter TctB family protein n=1 Tax=Jannaschia seohaensis TaxID=475081 RepID=A0A2Y9APB3_9RHOB|nr:tripartite tricarboxylate transporter TctB family protein [Jannaschia seohaensis]SSA44189.1 Tripartite tricarboxylate transporter TctB family protein [Jannaschia seohaensis]